MDNATTADHGGWGRIHRRPNTMYNKIPHLAKECIPQVAFTHDYRQTCCQNVCFARPSLHSTWNFSYLYYCFGAGHQLGTFYSTLVPNSLDFFFVFIYYIIITCNSSAIRQWPTVYTFSRNSQFQQHQRGEPSFGGFFLSLSVFLYSFSACSILFRDILS